MTDDEKTKTSIRTKLRKMDLKVISQCQICGKIILDDSNMKKHLMNHSTNEKESLKAKNIIAHDVISYFAKPKAIPTPEFRSTPSKRDGFLDQVVYHLDKCFIPFASVENSPYQKMHGHKSTYYKDADKFSRAILNLKHEFQESIKKVLKDTPIVSLMIDGWSDDSYKKYLGVIVCFVPNLLRLNDIPHEQILDLTKNNRGELQCKMFLSLKPIKDASESAQNLMEWVIEVLDFYEIRNKVIGIMSDKAAANVKMTALLYQELKTNSTLIKKTGEMFYLNCTAHLENRLITKISKGLKKLDKGWQKRIIRLVRLLHNNSSLKYKWLKFFGFILPNQNETRWFSEFRVYHLFLRSAPHLGRFLKDNKKNIFETDKDLFTYSTDELNEISLLLYLMAPLNELFFQLQKDNSNSAFFGLYYFKLIMKYLNDIEIITSGGRLRGGLGIPLKCFERFQNVEALSNTEHDLIQIFTDAKKLFMKEYYDQQFFTIHLVMDALNPYSKALFTQKMQKPDDFNK